MKRITFTHRQLGDSLIITSPAIDPYLRLVLHGKVAKRFAGRLIGRSKIGVELLHRFQVI